jgi:hypothetical protein
MIPEETKADIRKRLQEAKADNAAMDAMAFALIYEPNSVAEQKELEAFICREGRRMGALIGGCPD